MLGHTKTHTCYSALGSVNVPKQMHSSERFDKGVLTWGSQYVPLVMQDFCAVPCCILIVMLRRRLPLVPQEVLAYHLGLAIPAEDMNYVERFSNPKLCAVGEQGGLQLHQPGFHPSIALAKLGIPLHFQFVPVSALDAGQLRDMLMELTDKDEDRDVLLHFDRSVLDRSVLQPVPLRHAHRNRQASQVEGDGHKQRQHMCVFDKLMTCAESGGGDGYSVSMIDPAVDAPKWRDVEGARLLLAMQALGEEMLGGIWLLYARQPAESDDESDSSICELPPISARGLATVELTGPYLLEV